MASWLNNDYLIHQPTLLQKRKTLLRDVSMHVGPGELCYLMGPSGAGKTTLLEVLAGRVQIGESASPSVGRSVDRSGRPSTARPLRRSWKE